MAYALPSSVDHTSIIIDNINALSSAGVQIYLDDNLDDSETFPDFPIVEALLLSENEYFKDTAHTTENAKRLQKFQARLERLDGVPLEDRVEYPISMFGRVGLNFFDVDSSCRAVRPTTVRPPIDEDFDIQFEIQARYFDFNKLLACATVYCYDFLAFEGIKTAENLRLNATFTANQMERLVALKRPLEAAIVSLLLVRHSVLVIEDGVNNYDSKMNGWLSFRNDVAGKWCQPKGDLLLFPGLHSDAGVLRVALADLQKTAEILRPYRQKTFGPPVKVSVACLTTWQRFHLRICPNFRTYNLPQVDRIFKPIFTKQHYKLFTPACRLYAELYQFGYLVFLQLTDYALKNYDLGSALVFVQNMHRCMRSLFSLLPKDRSLKDYYTYTMCQWYVGRCYYAVALRIKRREIGTTYEKLQTKLETFSQTFYAPDVTVELLSDEKVLKGYPDSRKSCIQIAWEAYARIAIPAKWPRSVHEQEAVQLLHCHSVLLTCADAIRGERSEAYFTILKTLDDLHVQLELMRGNTRCSPQFRCTTLMLAARWAKLRNAYGINKRILTANINEVYEIKAEEPDLNILQYRSYVQRKALDLMNEGYDSGTHGAVRATLISTAKRTLFDEVIYCVEALDFKFDAYRIEYLANLLPAVVFIWFGSPASGGVPDCETNHFNQIMGMFFYGLTLGYYIMFRASNTSAFLQNAKYYYNLSVEFLLRPTVMATVVRTFMDHAYLTEKCIVDKLSLNQDNRLKRVFGVCRVYLHLLPALMEHCISRRAGGGPDNYNAVEIVVYYSVIHWVDDADHSDEVRYVLKRVCDYVKAGLNISDHLFVGQKGESGTERLGKPAPLFLEPFVYEKKQLKYKDNLEEFDLEDARPPPQGMDDCLYPECKIEQYHDHEENDVASLPAYNHEVLTEILGNFDGKSLDDTDTCDKLIRTLRRVLETLLNLAVRDLQQLMSKEKKCPDCPQCPKCPECPECPARHYVLLRSTDGSSAGWKHYTHLSFILSEIKVMKFNMGQNFVNEVIVTKVLYKLDRLLTDAAMLPLIRGTIEF